MVPPAIRRDVCARVERQKQSTRETHSLFGQIPDTSLTFTKRWRFQRQQPTSGETVRSTDSSRPRQRLLLSGDVHQNPGPATKYPCYVCTSNVTSRGVSYMCNRCSGWVHSKCSCLQNAAEYRRIKNWACISCSSPPTPQIPKPLPSPTTTKASDGDPFTILQFNEMASATNRLN